MMARNGHTKAGFLLNTRLRTLPLASARLERRFLLCALLIFDGFRRRLLLYFQGGFFASLLRGWRALVSLAHFFRLAFC
jgi:hypothetical protein